MSLIDQRILVAAPTDAVWAYLVTPSSMLKWNHLSKQLSILSTHPTGIGARRRSQDAQGHTIVEEITAWLENIGFEYRMVDGPYRNLKGRFRLQSVAEGTVVNWIVEYQLKGMLAGARDVIIFRRGYQRMMTESLRDLRKMVEASGVQLDPDKQARFAMQADPGVEARAARSTPEGKPIPRAERVVLPPAERPAAKPIVIDDDAELDTTLLPASNTPPKPMPPATAEVVAFLKQQWARDNAEPTPPPSSTPSTPIPTAPATPGSPAILHAFTPPTPAPISEPTTPSAQPVAERSPAMEEPSFVAKLAAEPAASTGGIHIDEPPISKEDTRPRKALQGLDHLPGHELNKTSTQESASPVTIDEPPVSSEDTPVSGTGRINVPPTNAGSEPSGESESHRAMTVPISMVAPPEPPPPPALTTQTMDVFTPPPPGQTPRPDSLPERVPTPPMIFLPPAKRVQIEDPDEAMIPDAEEVVEHPSPTAHHDTGEISIWDAFGLESPTQRGLAVLNEVVAQARATAEMAAVSASGDAAEKPATVKQDSQPIVPAPEIKLTAPTPPSAITRRATIHVQGWHGKPRQKSKPPHMRMD